MPSRALVVMGWLLWILEDACDLFHSNSFIDFTGSLYNRLKYKCDIPLFASYKTWKFDAENKSLIWKNYWLTLRKKDEYSSRPTFPSLNSEIFPTGLWLRRLLHSVNIFHRWGARSQRGILLGASVSPRANSLSLRRQGAKIFFLSYFCGSTFFKKPARTKSLAQLHK